MCYPDACSKQDIQTNNLLFFNESVYKYINNGAVVITFSPLLPEYINEDTGGCSDDAKFRGEWRAENYIVITLLAAIGLLVIVGTAADVLRRSDEERDSLKTNRAGLGFQMLTSFSVVSNLEFIFQSPPKKGSNRLDCFDGMRALSMTWVILGHNFLYGGVFLHGRNQKYRYSFYVDEIAGGPGLAFEPIFSDFSVDTFLFLGASLLSYLLLRDLDRTQGWFNRGGPARVLLFYLNRYLRLSVPLALVMGVYVGVLPLLVTQTTAAHLMAMNEAEECRRYWWRHLLYINIWRKEDGNTDGCLGQTWYLAFDMEWFLVSPLLVYPLWRTRLGPRQKVLGLGWWSLLFLALVFWTILWVPDMAAVDTYNKQHYLPDWNYAPWGCRSHCYMLGLMMGYILHTTRDKAIRINWGVNIGLWTLAFLLAVAQVYGPYDVDTWLEYRAWITTTIA